MKKPLTQEQMDKADVIFIGRARSIGVPACMGKPMCTGNHTIIFDIEKLVKGKEIGKSVEVNWQNGTFGEVSDVAAFHREYGARNKVGIILPETIKAHLHCGPQRAVTGNGKPVLRTSCSLGLPLPFYPQPNIEFNKPWIVSDVCSQSFIQKQTE